MKEQALTNGHKSKHSHHVDSTTEFRRNMERRVYLRRKLPKVIFAVLCVIALLAVCILVASYILI